MKEGADMLMVKPGLPYLDIVREVKNKVGNNYSHCQIPNTFKRTLENVKKILKRHFSFG